MYVLERRVVSRIAEVDPASRRLVFWLEMENNMLRERVEEGTLLADAMAKIMLRVRGA